jgi:hypothetical protein
MTTKPARHTSTRYRLGLSALGIAALLGCGEQQTSRQADAGAAMAAVPGAYIASPAQGDTVDGPDVAVEFEVTGITLQPAGTGDPGTGHLHVLVDQDLMPEGVVIPAEAGFVHLGTGGTEVGLTGLTPGPHRLIAVLGDAMHMRIHGAGTDTVQIVIR